jgi:tetratricopeptide (TPR) repeat protein
MIFSYYSFSQNTKLPNTDQNKPIILEGKIYLLQNNIDRLQKDIEKIKNEANENISSYKKDTKDLINLYVYFITAGLIIIGFTVNFFGKSAIKKRVEELITETAQKHIESKIVETLNSKITNELIEKAIKNKSEEEINKIIESIKDKGNTAINQIKTKGDEAIKSMLASPPKIHIKLENKNLSDTEITKQNDSLRADEFFKLAFKSTDPRIQIELYKNVIEIDPNNANALNNMGVSYINLNETKDAIEVLNKAVKLNSKYYQAYTNRAQAYNLQGNFEQALKDIASSIEIEPKFYYTYAIKGNILTKQGKFPEAEIALNTAVQINPNSAEAYYNQAYFYEERKEYDKSQRDYEKAEALDFPNKSMLYNNMAVLFRRLKQFDKAIEFIEKAKQYSPSFQNIYGTLALIYADKNDEENFYSNLKIALERGCQVWNYLSDPGFDNYRGTKRLQMLIEPYKKNFFA